MEITEYSLLLQHLTIYCNDNHSLSSLYSPYVATPKVSVAKHYWKQCSAHNNL